MIVSIIIQVSGSLDKQIAAETESRSSQKDFGLLLPRDVTTGNQHTKLHIFVRVVYTIVICSNNIECALLRKESLFCDSRSNNDECALLRPRFVSGVGVLDSEPRISFRTLLSLNFFGDLVMIRQLRLVYAKCEHLLKSVMHVGFSSILTVTFLS